MYVDDSGNSDPKSNRFYVLSGVIFHETDYVNIMDMIIDYKREYFVDEYRGAEIHVYEIWQNKGVFYNIDINTKKRLLDILYNLIGSLPITIISVGIDKWSIEKRFPDWNIFNAAWVFLTERFDKYLSYEGRSMNRGMLFIDKNSRMPDNEITAIVGRLRKYGSNYQSINYLHEDPLFLTSQDREALQMADAIAYCTMKRLCSHPVFTQYWLPIRTRYRSDSSGKIMGYGLKIFPDINDETI